MSCGAAMRLQWCTPITSMERQVTGGRNLEVGVNESMK
jgi:hypothetical protein